MQIESLLFQLVKEMDEGYLNGSGCVVKVSFQQFPITVNQAGLPGVVFGQYDVAARTIALNKFFEKPLKYGRYLKEVRSILWHELVHGFICNSAQPVRLGKYKDGADEGHGPAFRKWERMFADGLLTMEESSRMADLVAIWTLQQSGLES